MINARAIISIVAAFGAGVVLGVLIAPETGSVTRSKLVQKGKGVMTDLNQSITSKVREVVEKVKHTSKPEDPPTKTA